MNDSCEACYRAIDGGEMRFTPEEMRTAVDSGYVPSTGSSPGSFLGNMTAMMKIRALTEGNQDIKLCRSCASEVRRFLRQGVKNG